MLKVFIKDKIKRYLDSVFQTFFPELKSIKKILSHPIGIKKIDIINPETQRIINTYYVCA